MLFRVAKGLVEGDSELAGGIMLKTWFGHVLGIPPAKLPLVAGDREAWRSQLDLLPPQGQAGKRKYTELIQYFPQK